MVAEGGDQVVAVGDGGADLGGELGDQRVDAGEVAALLGIGGAGAGEEGNGFARGVGEGFEVDDLGVEAFESGGGVELSRAGSLDRLVRG